jgi:hypothetical protein
MAAKASITEMIIWLSELWDRIQEQAAFRPVPPQRDLQM